MHSMKIATAFLFTCGGLFQYILTDESLDEDYTNHKSHCNRGLCTTFCREALDRKCYIKLHSEECLCVPHAPIHKLVEVKLDPAKQETKGFPDKHCNDGLCETYCKKFSFKKCYVELHGLKCLCFKDHTPHNLLKIAVTKPPDERKHGDNFTKHQCDHGLCSTYCRDMTLKECRVELHGLQCICIPHEHHDHSSFKSISEKIAHFEKEHHKDSAESKPAATTSKPTEAPAAQKSESFDEPSFDAPSYDASAFAAPSFDAPSYDASAFDAPSYDGQEEDDDDDDDAEPDDEEDSDDEEDATSTKITSAAVSSQDNPMQDAPAVPEDLNSENDKPQRIVCDIESCSAKCQIMEVEGRCEAVGTGTMCVCLSAEATNKSQAKQEQQTLEMAAAPGYQGEEETSATIETTDDDQTVDAIESTTVPQIETTQIALETTDDDQTVDAIESTTVPQIETTQIALAGTTKSAEIQATTMTEIEEKETTAVECDPEVCDDYCEMRSELKGYCDNHDGLGLSCDCRPAEE